MKKRRIDVFALTQFSYLSRPLLFRSLTLVRSSNKSRFTYIPRGIQQPSFLTARFRSDISSFPRHEGSSIQARKVGRRGKKEGEEQVCRRLAGLVGCQAYVQPVTRYQSRFPYVSASSS